MKNFLAITASIILLSSFAVAANGHKEHEGDEDRTKLSLYSPGFLVKAAAGWIDEEDAEAKSMMKKLRSISITIREGSAYREYFARPYEKKMKKLERQNFEQLVTVRDEEEKVSIQLRQNKKAVIRQLAVVVDDGSEEYVFLRIRCHVNEEDLQQWLDDSDIVHDEIRSAISASL